jgi:hypothetical protein
MRKLHRAGTRRALTMCVAALLALLASVSWGYQAAPTEAQTGLPPSLAGEGFFARDGEPPASFDIGEITMS